MIDPDWIVPTWAAPCGVRAFVTTRHGGSSRGPWGAGTAGGMNLGALDDPDPAVAANRRRLAALLPAAPVWLHQVHGARVLDAAHAIAGDAADALIAVQRGAVCAVRVADCLPVLLADARGRGVGVAHAGWRGLAAGVVQNTVAALRAALGDPGAELHAFLGPAIGRARFEVGDEVLVEMRRRLPDAEAAFVRTAPGRWHADLCALARQALAAQQVTQVSGGTWCTYDDPSRFYSFRRDRVTGRHAALVWLAQARDL